MAASPGASLPTATSEPPPARCPHCGSAPEAGPSTGRGPPAHPPSSQPDDAAAPGLDAVTGGTDPCTTCGFVLDEGVWDERPALPRDRGENDGGGGAGNGGRASGPGEGVFLPSSAGAEEAAVAAAGRTGAPALRLAHLALPRLKHSSAFASLAEMAGIARKTACLGVARHYLRTALAVPALAGPGRVPHHMLAAAALLLAAREDGPSGRATHVADIAAAAGVDPSVLASAYRHFLSGIGALNPERAPGGTDFLVRALARARPLPRPPPGQVLAPGLCLPSASEHAARELAEREAGALIGWATGPAGPRANGRPLPVTAVGAAAAVLGAAGAGLTLSTADAADAFQALPAAVNRTLGTLRKALAAAAAAAPWLGKVRPGEVHLHIATLVRASGAVAARRAAAETTARAAALPAGAAVSALPAPAAPATPAGGKKKRGGGGGGGGREPPRTRSRTEANVVEAERDDDEDDINWAEYIRTPEEVAFVRSLMGGGGE